MKRAAIFSAVFHLLLILVSIFGLPFFNFKKDLMLPTPVPVEILPIAEETQAPNPSPLPAKEDKKDAPSKPEPKPLPEPTPPSQVPETKPEPKPETKPEPKPSEQIPPKDESKPDDVAEEVAIERKEKPKPDSKPVIDPPKPLAKPKPPVKKDKEKNKKSVSAFDSVLKNIAKIKTSTQTDDKADKMTEGSSSSQAGNVGPTLTMSEIDALRQQISGCWSINPGAKDIDKLVITLEIWVNQDRTVRDVKIIDSAEHANNPFYRSVAESAVRAVRDPRCSPLKLPANKYDQWKDMILNFRPPV